jgi:hypothetical protein
MYCKQEIRKVLYSPDSVSERKIFQNEIMLCPIIWLTSEVLLMANSVW